MSKKDNFGKAMFDMFGVGEDPKNDDALEAPDLSWEERVPAIERIPNAESRGSDGSTTVLAPGAVFEGTLSSQGNVDLSCQFKGDIQAEGDVTLRAEMCGNVQGSVVELISCVVNGDIHASVCVRMDERSKINGNIWTNDLNACGTIIGNVDAKGKASLTGKAALEGDMAAGSLSIEEGVCIHGALQIPRRKGI